ncbi:hexameric tyrosine-coordinated heme protein [Ottowia sp.]|uniref:hexameric tyrosine-coordinated heme protein n=1 Tax=Ottowia sp. TaxID=1898956 RepID=UPI002BB485A6|nr:hexameric tyrosine-coordinated heme protein [Ottowia sp.]HRN77134.1 hexameric tyrosine-coordinated heme protein [Ottowia sp.]HRQ03268.1 hexameric tyrosine-coordinated heme protein [Ottowia sp.]
MHLTPTPNSIRPFTHRLAAPLVAAVFAFGMAAGAVAQDKPATPTASAGLTSLITATPEEGFALAVKLSQKGVGTVQKDVDVRKALRPVYSHDPDSLIAVSHVIATHFQTVAAANNYWRK